MRLKVSKEHLILASESSRRKELLFDAGLKFEIMPSFIDEDNIKTTTPIRLVKELSLRKAQAIAQTLELGERTIIAADTVVYRSGFFHKPVDFDDAFRTISRLNGKWHRVYTGVTLLNNQGSYTFFDCSFVKFKKLSEVQIINYINDSEPYDKAGAYGIQDKQIVERYKGSYSNIVGLPMEKFSKLLGVTNDNSGAFY